MTEVGNCLNCGHALYVDPSKQELHHFTRSFHAHGYPYSDVKCYAVALSHGGWCGCEKPKSAVKRIPKIRVNGYPEKFEGGDYIE